jgi:hypothetical protein
MDRIKREELTGIKGWKGWFDLGFWIEEVRPVVRGRFTQRRKGREGS